MKRVFKLSTLAGAIAAAVVLKSLVPVTPPAANAQFVYRTWNGGTYYGGGYAPGYGGGYSGYGYSPYGYGGYTYVAPRAYVYPPYRSHGIFGPGAVYNGGIGRIYGGPGFYGQPYRPYGYGGYGPYGY